MTTQPSSMLLSPNAYTGSKFEQQAGTSCSSYRNEGSVLEEPQTDQAWVRELAFLGTSLGREGQEAWQQLLCPPCFSLLAWTCDLLDLSPTSWQGNWSLRFDSNPETVRESEKRVNCILYLVPQTIWHHVHRIRQDPNWSRFSDQVLELWSRVPADIRKHLRPTSSRNSHLNRPSIPVSTQQSGVSSATPSTNTDHDHGQVATGSSQSGSTNNDFHRRDGVDKIHGKKRPRGRFASVYFCPVSDCTHKKEGYKNFGSCVNHVFSSHADLPRNDKEWRSKIRCAPQYVDDRRQSDQDTSSRSLNVRKHPRKETQVASDEIEVASITAATIGTGRAFKSPSASGSPNEPILSPLPGQAHGFTASINDNPNLWHAPTPWYKSNSQAHFDPVAFDKTFNRNPADNISSASWNCNVHLTAPTRTATPTSSNPRVWDQNRLHTPTTSSNGPRQWRPASNN